MSENNFSDDSDDNELELSQYGKNNRNIYFGGTLEKSKLLSQKENQAKLNRLNEVRKQEKELAKQKREQFKNIKQIEEDEEEKKRKLEEYAEKMRLIQELSQMKSLANQEIGMAHRRAEDVENTRKTRLQLEKEEKERVEQITQERSKQALDKQKKIDEDRYNAVHQYLERRKQVLETEYTLAHKNAEVYRENIKTEKSEEPEEQMSYDQYNKNVSRKTFSTKGSIDFTKSHLHNPIVVNHKNDLDVETAIDKAKQEAEKTSKRQEDILNQKDDLQKKAAERANKINQAEKSKKILDEFDSEMKKLEKADKALKIQTGKVDPRTELKPAVIKQNQNKIQEDAAKEFEDKFLTQKPTVSRAVPIKTEPTKYQDELVVVVDGDDKNIASKNTQKKIIKNTSKENLQSRPANNKAAKSQNQTKLNSKPAASNREKSPIHEDKSEDRVQKSDRYSNKKNPVKNNIQEETEEDDEEEKVLQPRIIQSQPTQQNNPNINVTDQYYPNQNFQNPPFFYQFPNQFYPQQFPPQFNNFMMPSNGMFYPNQFMNQQQAFGYEAPDLSSKTQTSQENRSAEKSDKRITYSESKSEKQQEPDNEIKNYIKEQEDFLQKLENDRKKLKEKLNNEQKPDKQKPSSQLQENIPSRSNEIPHQNFKKNKDSQEYYPEKTTQNRGRNEHDELAELQRKTDELLEKFMNPSERSKSRSKSPKGHVQFANFRDYHEDRSDQEQEDNDYEESETTPRKSEKKKNYKSHGSSPISELNYSISEKDKSAIKSQNMSQTFERSKLLEMEKSSHGYQTFGNREYEDQQRNHKGWKMDINQDEDDNVEEENDGTGDGDGEGLTLADMFKKNKKKIMERYEQQKERQKSEERESKGKRTKEEILRQRKEMMKPNLIKKNIPDEDEKPKDDDGYQYGGKFDKKGKKEPNPELLSRLAKGEKTKVDKKEMKALTNKNYELLPEVKRKREEEKKKEELKQRLQKSRQIGNKIRDDMMSKAY